MEFNCDSPEANVAWDDVLLAREVEAVRLWESKVPFVVVGRSGRTGEDVLNCNQVPIVRRSSGGGTVVQGPGCLNFSFVLSTERRPELASVARSYCVILGWITDALAVPGLAIKGSDILWNGRKMSGSAQRRTRGWLLHHGTLLYDAMDLTAVSRLLREPSRQPQHRGGRTHAEFLAKLPYSRNQLVDLLSAHEAFQSLSQRRDVLR